jgi:glycosyltransferase involved in cell wall biosynthesis
MNVLILIHSLAGGGAERVTVNLASLWARSGWQVTLVTLAGTEVDHFSLHPGVRRVALGLARDSAGLWAALFNNARRLWVLRGVLRQVRPDVALAMMHSASVLLAVASLGLPLTTVGAERAQPSAVPLGRMWNVLRWWAYGYLDAMVALTQESAAWIKHHTRATRVEVIPNSVIWPLPAQAAHLDPASVGRPGGARLLAVGRLAPVKGMDTLLVAFARLAPVHPDWELVIVGEGPQRADLEQFITQHGLTGRVFLAGHVGNPGDWYNSARLFVLTSRHEGFPNVLAEAMAHGLACVSFDCEAGPRHIIQHDTDGWLVPDQDTEALVEALDRLMRDDALRGRYATRALEIHDRLGESGIAAHWRRLFEEVAGVRA